MSCCRIDGSLCHTLYLLQPDLDRLLLAVNMGWPDGYVERGKQQVLFSVSANTQQGMIAEVAVNERQQVAFGVLVAELFNQSILTSFSSGKSPMEA